MSRNAGEIALAEHRRWLESVLASPSRHLLIGEQGSEPVGVVRFDLHAEEAEVSIYLVPSHRGRGQGAPLLRAAEAWLRRQQPAVKRLHAKVNAGNAASHRLFQACGYAQDTTEYVKRT
jgi:RimJ/RimL family protein N-acetyltransferase